MQTRIIRQSPTNYVNSYKKDHSIVGVEDTISNLLDVSVINERMHDLARLTDDFQLRIVWSYTYVYNVY